MILDRCWSNRRLVERTGNEGLRFGCLGDIAVGVVGGLIGGWLAVLIFKVPNAVNGINWQSILVAFLGSIVVILVVRVLRGRRG